ncbi:hypothetical protein BC834DRAFT_907998 [Gloeopeniophorella convolvens]|nr:hypothetical protein BC834DRAFT_907998 [Gloeopeniophorella convolvens]
MPVGPEQVAHHAVHMGDLPYDADPVLRADSPNDSLSTAYGPDETLQTEKDLSEHEFVRRIEETLRFHSAQAAEVAAERSPLLAPVEEGDEEGEKARFAHAMLVLRRAVAKVEEEESAEAALMRGPRGMLEDPPSADDLTTIMQGLMGPPLMHAQSPSPDLAPMSPMLLETSHTFLYDRTIGFAAGKAKLWIR